MGDLIDLFKLRECSMFGRVLAGRFANGGRLSQENSTELTPHLQETAQTFRQSLIRQVENSQYIHLPINLNQDPIGIHVMNHR
jgi:hypothetical protein